MKILYIAHNGLIQGSGFALLNIIKGMQSKGVDILVMIPYKGILLDKLEELGVRYYVSPLYNAVYPPLSNVRDAIRFIPLLLRTLWCNYKSANLLKKIIRKESPDIVHSNTGVIHLGFRIAQKLGIPHVWHLREFQNLDFGWSPIGGMANFKNKLLLDGNYNIAITQSVFSHYDLHNTNSKIIYDGVFSAGLKQNQVCPKNKYLLFVGSILKGKGPQVAIDAFMQIASQYSDYELWLVGDNLSDFAVHLQRRVLNSPYAKQIKFLGFRHDIAALMKSATALLVCSESEGFGFITVEAMYNHCLVIGHNTAGTKEQFDNGLLRHGSEIGLRYETSQDLVQVLSDVLHKGVDYYEPIISRAYETVCNLYTVEHNSEAVYQFYLDILRDEK